MKAEIRTKQFILCPNCGESEHSIQHFLDDGLARVCGPWRCQECHHEFSFNIEGGKPRIIKVEKTESVPMLSLLRFRDLYVVVERFSKIKDKEDWYDYLFHSHQCPTNIMGDIIEVFDKDEVDPHGLFRFITALEDTESNREKLDKVFKKEDLFELFETDGSEAPTAWPEEDKGVLSFIAEARYKKENVMSMDFVIGNGQGLDYDNIWCSCPECNGVVRIGSKHERASGGTYDAVCPGCGHGFQYMYEETTEELIDKTVVNFEKLKRKKKIGQLIKQLKLKGYIE